MRPLFLETTIQGEKIFAERLRKECIRRNISNRKACTSVFVFNEFKKTFLHSAIKYQNLLIDSPDPLTALRRSKRYSERIHKRITDIYATLCEEEENNKEASLERLEMWIEDGFKLEFMNYIEEPIINETGCKWASEDPIKIGDRYEINISCRKAKPQPCKIETFFQTHRKELRLLSTDNTLDSNKELKKIVETARLLISGKDKPYGQNCHLHLSDTIIALESPINSKIYTTNKKHFDPICKALRNREVYKETK